MYALHEMLPVSTDCKSYYKKKPYIIVLRTVYIFLSMHIDYTKLTFEYFRREINRRRTTGHEVAAVVCIHP